MRRNIDQQVLEMIKITKENPGKYTMASLSHELDIGLSSARSYSLELGLQLKRRTVYTDQQRQFVKDNATTMTNPEICKAIGLRPYQVHDIANKEGVTVLVMRKAESQQSEFFEHDKSWY